MKEASNLLPTSTWCRARKVTTGRKMLGTEALGTIVDESRITRPARVRRLLTMTMPTRTPTRPACTRKPSQDGVRRGHGEVASTVVEPVGSVPSA